MRQRPKQPRRSKIAQLLGLFTLGIPELKLIEHVRNTGLRSKNRQTKPTVSRAQRRAKRKAQRLARRIRRAKAAG